MKTKALFLALLAVVSSVAFAHDAPVMTVVSQKGSEVFKVIYKGNAIGKVRLNILDATGKTIHSETFSQVNGFILPVNFKGLASGQYTIEVVDNSGRYRELVSFKPVFELKSIHVSKILAEDGKYLLAIANAQNELINVKIYDHFQRVVYNESKTFSGDYAQVFAIQNPSSHYTFEVSDAGGNKKFFSF